MEKDTLVKVVNRSDGRVGYAVPDIGVRRQFMPREEKEITFDELQRLAYIDGGRYLLEDFLVIRDEAVVKEVLGDIEPEYFYKKEDVERICDNGSFEEFLDLLDFAPVGVLELVKSYAVETELNDVAKRKAILEKLSFDVSKAIEFSKEQADGEKAEEKPARRVAAPSARRVAAPKTTDK